MKKGTVVSLHLFGEHRTGTIVDTDDFDGQAMVRLQDGAKLVLVWSPFYLLQERDEEV